ncbi:uncharacterized protein K02A2.6-like [Patiria miniata]|uniref:Integrase catalytic domain-containing protein n=1 Tax=Patiria miniata TaxID=46514 RepID=A0A913Z540_PATMI|nr:uncharacterized protein K02A2.6-like [Patiria miniata]
MVREVNESSDDDEDNTQYDVAGVNLQEPRKQLEDLMIDYIAGQESGDWTETCQIGRNKVDFKLDSGSQADILPEDCFKNTGLALLPSKASLKSYSGHKIKALGKTIANLKQFREETAADPTLAKVKGHIMNGWPVDKHHLTSDVGPYYAVHNELVFCDGIIFLGNRVVVPRSMQKDMLKKIHESHLGIVKLKQRARAILYWPGMNLQIEDTVAKCAICQSSRKTQPAEPMIQHDIPDRPWSKLGADVFHLGVNYLLVVDYYSKFPEVQALQDHTAHSVIHELKIIFARSGTPDLLITDNASQFVCEDFRTFQNMWEFRHVTSSPRYPQSNGQAERCIQTVKTLMKKAKVSGRDPYMALLEYRNTPLDGTEGYAPAQLLNSRLLKSRLPTSSTLLQSQV